jgi:ribonuclease HII
MLPFSFGFDEDFCGKSGISAGVDEAGRGTLAGPVTAAAVILPRGLVIPGLNDSKQLSADEREFLFEIIKKEAVSYTVKSVDNKIIDRINILQATFVAMARAIGSLKVKPDICLIDGNCKVPHLSFKQRAVVRGDAKSASIAAASILAKVSRDRIMVRYAGRYPLYGFERHKGYGTKKHVEALKKYGACPIHRITFSPVSAIVSQHELDI